MAVLVDIGLPFFGSISCAFLMASCLGGVCERVSFWDSAQPAWAYGYAGHESVALRERRN